MKIAAALLAFSLLIGQMATPASALSCMQPEPIDWSQRFPNVEAAVIGVVESVKQVVGDDDFEALLLEVRVTETLHGRTPAVIEYAVGSFSPWGPFYEKGQELAIVVENGDYRDGNQSLCGPYFGPEELRAAAAEFGGVPEQPIGSLEFIRLFLDRLFSFLRVWAF